MARKVFDALMNNSDMCLQFWPCCQNFSTLSTGEGDFWLTFSPGVDIVLFHSMMRQVAGGRKCFSTDAAGKRFLLVVARSYVVLQCGLCGKTLPATQSTCVDEFS